MKLISSIISPIILSTALLGCATQPAGSGDNSATADRNNAKIGAIVGAVAGAIVGGQLDDDGNRDKGMILGAIAGAAAAFLVRSQVHTPPIGRGTGK